MLMAFCFCICTGLSQQVPDSIIQQYHAAKTQIEKRVLTTRFTNSYRDNPNFFATIKLLTSYLKSVNDQESADYVQLLVNDQLAKTGDYVMALSSSLEILNQFEKNKNKQGVYTASRALSVIYYYAGDKTKDIQYAQKAALIAKELNNYKGLYGIYNNISTSYTQANMPDSGLAYAFQAIAYARKTGDSANVNSILGTLGEAYIGRKEYDKALFYLRKSFNNLEFNEVLPKAWACNDLAQIFLETNRYDSAQFYARQAIEISRINRFNDQMQRAYEYLSRSFEKTNVPDSALKYLHLAVFVKDSLYSSEKSKQLQGINAREQKRIQEMEKAKTELRNKIRTYSLLGGLAILGCFVFFLFRNNKQKQRANKILELTLSKLTATQSQLIQSEKMASLGELTSGIAHEIQNPLNFVNNFSDVNAELIDELVEEADKGNTEEVKAIAKDIKENEQKINHHGKRADSIIKSMMQHSRSSSGVKEPTDINALCDEYLRLAYHGLRAKDKSFNATMKTDFDESIGKINIIPQDIGRVILNLITNAFYAAPLPPEGGFLDPDYLHSPTVWVSTKRIGTPLGDGGVLISVRDNGPGIPEKILGKIFQPFFTTKPTGQGTGLGLSLAYDIVKAHGGELKVETKKGEGSEFVIMLPV